MSECSYVVHFDLKNKCFINIRRLFGKENRIE